ncbi:hypothetical protein V8F33_007055 [Rhypophila sp. PSN 637]
MTVIALQNNSPAVAVKTFLPKLAFGIEIEIMLSPKRDTMVEGNRFRSLLLEHGWKDHVVSSPEFCTEPQLENRSAMRHAVREALQQETAMKVRHGWDYSTAEYDKRYTVWSICHEGIPEPPGFWSMEIVSRVLSTDDDWPAEIERVFDVLTKYCHVRTTFEMRLPCACLAGNRNKVHRRTAVGHLQRLEVLQGPSKAVGRNFLGLTGLGDATRTIEFRRPPGVISAAQAKHWAAFVVCLFSEALSTNWAVEEQRLINRFDHPNVQEFGDFVTRGLERLGSHNKTALAKEWLKEDHSKAPTEDEQEKLMFEWREEN